MADYTLKTYDFGTGVAIILKPDLYISIHPEKGISLIGKYKNADTGKKEWAEYTGNVAEFIKRVINGN